MKKALLALLLLMGVMFAVSPSAFADVPTSPASTNSVAELELSALSVQLLIGLVVPIVVGLITKLTTSSGLKALVMLVINAAQTLLVQATMADGTAIISKQTFIVWIFALIVSVASYAGVYKPLNLTSSTEGGKLSPNRGLF